MRSAPRSPRPTANTRNTSPPSPPVVRSFPPGTVSGGAGIREESCGDVDPAVVEEDAFGFEQRRGHAFVARRGSAVGVDDPAPRNIIPQLRNHTPRLAGAYSNFTPDLALNHDAVGRNRRHDGTNLLNPVHAHP